MESKSQEPQNRCGAAITERKRYDVPPQFPHDRRGRRHRVGDGIRRASSPWRSPPAVPHGHHGMAGPDEMIGHLIASAKSQLNLNTSQQGMFDTAVADSKAAFQSGRALHQKVRDTLNGRACEDRARPRGRGGGGRRGDGPGPRAAQGDPRRMARALRHVHAGPEGRREGHAAEAPREGRFDQGEDARALQGARAVRRDRPQRANPRSTDRTSPASRRALSFSRRRRDRPARRHAFRWPLPRRS